MFSDATSQISAADAAELLTGDAVLLDVREQHEWDAGHAPQARHLAMSELSGRVSEIPPDVTVICVCHGGGRSGAVSDALNRAGFNALNLSGGMVAWEAAGLPVVDDAGAPGEVI
ncbi:rhodanese-like domain-containing protein [Jatrophihabitans sp.]|jgi:rhodanese-related sulfurtransferase|uniref:rhodanese-like domain-containing protein n=1 Tax=Jatrophihabitans sp. TaxID=1932789 RepID=UPI002EE97318